MQYLHGHGKNIIIFLFEIAANTSFVVLDENYGTLVIDVDLKSLLFGKRTHLGKLLPLI